MCEDSLYSWYFLFMLDFICITDLEILVLDQEITASRTSPSNNSNSRVGEEATTATSTTPWPTSTVSTATTVALTVGRTPPPAIALPQTGGATEEERPSKISNHILFIFTVVQFAGWQYGRTSPLSMIRKSSAGNTRQPPMVAFFLDKIKTLAVERELAG